MCGKHMIDNNSLVVIPLSALQSDTELIMSISLMYRSA